MARSEARLSVSIWSDPDFLALGPAPQRMFMFLLSQPDLAHDGVIALRERRWSKSAAGLTRADVEQALADLAAARFVVVDEDTEELLVRSFIRRDKVYRQPNVLRAAQDHLEVVTSPAIRAAIAVELRRIAESGDLRGEPVRIVTEMLDALGNPSGNPSPNPSGKAAGHPPDDDGDPGPNPPDDGPHDHDGPDDTSEAPDTADTPEQEVAAGRNPSRNPSANPSGNPSAGTPGERGVVTAVSSGSPFPVPLSPDPDPHSPPPAARPRASARDTPTADADFDAFWSAYPRRAAKRTARKAWDKAITRATPAEITAGAARYRDRPGRELRFTAHPATWLNGDRWTDDPPRTSRDLALPGQPAAAPEPQSTADKRFADAMALAAKFAAEEAS
ncbi:hypothetical protein ACFOX0_17945 [Micromonospora zhanjiangensis]|uniref:Helix-turn-helix domain-containing protein n=1 Tax=Micromonospora zhanjiangensis TaxID=1522057 RepID=A0ABV8KNU4_9ACTN